MTLIDTDNFVNVCRSKDADTQKKTAKANTQKKRNKNYTEGWKYNQPYVILSMPTGDVLIVLATISYFTTTTKTY